MKKLLSTMFIAAVIATMVATPANADESVYGVIFKETAQPGGGSGSVTTYKQGSATCKSFFGLVALGDCSIKSAMDDGNIKTLSHYDQDVINILGFKKVTTKAYGQ